MNLPESTYDHIEDFAEKAWDRFPFRYTGKRRIRALVKALADGTQILEDLIYDVLMSEFIDSATGEALDTWGELAGATRGPLVDSVYRKIVKARMLVNVTSGKTDELIQIYEIATAPSDVRWWDHYPAGFRLTAHRKSPMSAPRRRRFRELMEDAKGGGIGMSLCEALPGSLKFDEGNDNGFNSTFSRTI